MSTRSRRNEASVTALMWSGLLFTPTLLTLVVEREPELGRDDHVIAQRLERLTDELLVHIRPVRLRGVEQRDAPLDGTPEERDHLVPVTRRPIALAHPHAAQPEGGDLQPTAEYARCHRRAS